MSGLNLVIADKDQSYLDSVVDFLGSKYQNRFFVQAFSNETAYKEYINKAEKIDILLISPDFYHENLPWANITAAVVWSSGILPREIKGCEVISKYQTGDRLVGCILNIFSEKSKNEVYIKDGGKDTRIITFFSPCGGSGKTTLAVSASARYAAKGMKAFYLNMERFPVTAAYFADDGVQNLSNMLFYLKENNKNLALKIEGCRSVDPATGVHFFNRPGNIFDTDDLTQEELDRLFNQFKSMGCYDRLVIDIPSDLNGTNISILDKSDVIFLVLPCNHLSRLKADVMLEGFEILEKRRGIRLLNKLELVINKYDNSGVYELDELRINDKPAFIKIPYIKGFDMKAGTGVLKDCMNPLGSAVDQIVGKF